jgi:MoaA/NifB/PqqE/SkfB family radical SAM enzyme
MNTARLIIKNLKPLLVLFVAELKRLVLSRKYILEVDITNQCNRHCAHCYQQHNPNRGAKDTISLEDWENRFRKYYSNGIRVVNLLGGEPSLRPDVLLAANRIFPLVTTISNGYEKIPAEFNHRILLSIDGDENQTDHLRGKGYFAKVKQNYKGDHRIALNCVLTPKNLSAVSSIFEVARDMGACGVTFNLYSSRKGDTSEHSLSRDQRMELRERLFEAKKRHGRLLLMNTKMINWITDGRHADSCYWRDWTVHLDNSETIRICYGDLPDCDRCGCYAGALGNLWWGHLPDPSVIVRAFFL